MSAHTPGPWFVEPDKGYFNITAVDELDVVGCEGIDKEANARLIAAAPELLEALKKCVSWMESPDEGAFSDSDLLECKQAIAKAGGRA